jgi:hypothetical protein
MRTCRQERDRRWFGKYSARSRQELAFELKESGEQQDLSALIGRCDCLRLRQPREWFPRRNSTAEIQREKRLERSRLADEQHQPAFGQQVRDNEPNRVGLERRESWEPLPPSALLGAFPCRPDEAPSDRPLNGLPAGRTLIRTSPPAFFVYPPYESGGLIAARFNDGFGPVGPEYTPSDEYEEAWRPARPREIVALFGTGWGPTTANLQTGELAPEAAPLEPAANPTVTFGGIRLAAKDLLYVGAAPNAAGLYQLNIRVPAGAQPGNHQVMLTVYGKSTPVGPVIPVAAP